VAARRQVALARRTVSSGCIIAASRWHASCFYCEPDLKHTEDLTMFAVMLFLALGLLAGLIARLVLGDFDASTNINQH
jgi:hypothetical protein